MVRCPHGRVAIHAGADRIRAAGARPLSGRVADLLGMPQDRGRGLTPVNCARPAPRAPPPPWRADPEYRLQPMPSRSSRAGGDHCRATPLSLQGWFSCLRCDLEEFGLKRFVRSARGVVATFTVAQQVNLARRWTSGRYRPGFFHNVGRFNLGARRRRSARRESRRCRPSRWRAPPSHSVAHRIYRRIPVRRIEMATGRCCHARSRRFARRSRQFTPSACPRRAASRRGITGLRRSRLRLVSAASSRRGNSVRSGHLCAEVNGRFR